MLWRDHIVLTALYPLDVIRKRAYQLVSCFFLVFVILGGFAFHAANAQEETGDKGFPNSNVVPDIVPGMQVTVDIIGGKRTVLDYILSPIQKATAVAFREK